MTLQERIEAKKQGLGLKTKREEEQEVLASSPDKDLEQLVDDTLKEVKNLKEGEDIYPETEPILEKEIPKKIREEFENLEKSIKNKSVEKKMISNTEIYEKLLTLQANINDVSKNVQDKKQEQINITTMIFDRLRFLKAHISKWFFGILVITFLSGGVVFTTVYHNWDSLTPAIDKLTSLFNFANSAKRIVN